MAFSLSTPARVFFATLQFAQQVWKRNSNGWIVLPCHNSKVTCYFSVHQFSNPGASMGSGLSGEKAISV